MTDALARLHTTLRETEACPPVEKWNPPSCGDIDIRIARDGTWYYLGTPIGRKPMVKLFSRILRRDPDGEYYLVTPVEKCRIRVDDAPLFAIAMTEKEEAFIFETATEDVVTAGPDHPIRVETDPETGEPAPYIHVRGGLEAKISRSVFYELVERASLDGDMLEIVSNGMKFRLGAVTP